MTIYMLLCTFLNITEKYFNMILVFNGSRLFDFEIADDPQDRPMNITTPTGILIP